jgi:ABC-type multidrug transport system fused ATPase/permease subunit
MAKPSRFLEEETRLAGRYSKSVLRTLSSAYKPYFAPISFFLLIGFCGRAFLMFNANLVGYWVDSFCRAPAHCRPVPSALQGFSNQQFVFLMVATTLLGLLLTLIFRIGFARRSARAISTLYDEVTLRTSRLPMSFFDSTPAGRIITRFSSDYGNVFRMFGGPLAEFIGIIFDLIAMLFLITLASPYYLPICIFIAALNYAVYRLNRERLRRERRLLSANRSPSIAHFAETTQGASTIRAYLKQGGFASRFSKLNDLFLNQKLRTTGVILGFSFQMNTLTALLLLVIGVSGYWMTNSGLVSIGSIAVAFSFITLSGNTLQMFFEWVAQFEEAMIGVERLDNYLQHPIESGLNLPASRQYLTAHPSYTEKQEKEALSSTLFKEKNAAVDIRGLWFRYREDLPFVLKGLNLQVAAGERLGVIGRTGSGKTSLIQALFYLYPVDRGDIKIDGHAPRFSERNSDDPNRIDLNIYRRAIALISQEPTLFKGSLRENLDLAGSKSDAELLEVMSKVGLSEWLQAQPQGLHSEIEERGRNLSMGERQLVCMARCLLQASPIVVMDEATSSVDPQSEEILVRATQEFFADRTQIIVAHRLSTRQHCHRILWLQNGEVKMLGTPDEVLPIFEKARLQI